MFNANGFWDLKPSGNFEMVTKGNSIDILGVYIKYYFFFHNTILPYYDGKAKWIIYLSRNIFLMFL